MINWIILLYYYLTSLDFLSIELILTQNLPLLLVCRGIYIITYYLNYHKDYLDEVTGQKQLFTKKEVYYFSFKQIALILFSSLLTPVSVFVAFFSLLVSGQYLKALGNKVNQKFIKIIGNIFYFFSPIIGIAYYTFLDLDYLSTAAVAISLMVMLFYGLKNTQLSLSKLLEKYDRRKITKIPKTVLVIVFVFILTIPSMVIIGAAVYNPEPKKTYYVSMRDDILLATDVYFAPGSFQGPRPVVLVRTTYGKDGMGALYGLLYSIQDYHLVVQDCRGTFDSPAGNDYILFSNAYKDGVDTIEWIMEQPWCNGKIASVGASALGINEFFYAGMNPTGLVAQSIMISTPDLYKTSIYQGGAFKESITTGWTQLTAPDNYEYQLAQMINHPMKDSFYNSTSLFMDIGPSFKNVSVSALHIGGWFDTFQQGTLDGYMGYDDLGLPSARGKQLLIMGPFTHGFPTEGKQGQVFFPTRSINSFVLYTEWEQKLLNHAFYGSALDWTGNRVAYYMMGDVNDTTVNANDYRFAKDWPVPHENDTWYLNPGGNLLNNSLPSISANYSFLYDPRNPVPTLGGTNLLLPAGPYDQRPIEIRPDVLIWESSVLLAPYEIVGQMWAHLYVKSNCTNTDFTVKISDVYPDGSSMLITDGIINAVRRDGFNSTAEDLNSVEFAEVDIDLWSTAYQFNIGHKIRIAISSSNYPRFAANPNSGAPQEIYSYQYLQKYIANNTILTGQDYPSYILLPRPL